MQKITGNGEKIIPKKYKAHSIVNEALKTGKLKKPNKCSNCNQEKNVQAHHEDYNKPLEIIWLCVSCHSQLHKQKKIENGYEYKEHKYIKKGYNNKGKSKPYKKDWRYEKSDRVKKRRKTIQGNI